MKNQKESLSGVCTTVLVSIPKSLKYQLYSIYNLQQGLLCKTHTFEYYKSLKLPPSSKYFSFSDCNSARNGGTFCLASISKCFKSNSTDSSFALLMNVVAIPVFPDRPVRPIQ